MLAVKPNLISGFSKVMMGEKWIVALTRRGGFEIFDGDFATARSQYTAENLAFLRIRTWL